MKLNDNQYKELVLEMLIKISTEQDAIKNLLMNEYVHRRDIIDPQKELDSVNSLYSDLLASSRRNLMAQLKNRYGLDGSVDDLLNSVFLS